MRTWVSVRNHLRRKERSLWKQEVISCELDKHTLTSLTPQINKISLFVCFSDKSSNLISKKRHAPCPEDDDDDGEFCVFNQEIYKNYVRETVTTHTHTLTYRPSIHPVPTTLSSTWGLWASVRYLSKKLRFWLGLILQFSFTVHLQSSLCVWSVDKDVSLWSLCLFRLTLVN